MKKTWQYYFNNYLTKEEQKEFVRNIWFDNNYITLLSDNLYQFINKAFTWSWTSKWHKYWYNIAKRTERLNSNAFRFIT